ncbi:MAG: hypothetical protein ACRYFS_07930 [Janthinobacterium lividum]
MTNIKVFDYIEALDAFLVTSEFIAVSERLGLAEWTPVVWIGRLFFLDNDYGEHWFDNWDEREALEIRAAELGIDGYDLMIVVPSRFQDGKDGPCNTDTMRKVFWTDVLKSLTLSYELMFEQARYNNQPMKDLKERLPNFPELYLLDLEERISELRASCV